jgi:hypothetical protein
MPTIAGEVAIGWKAEVAATHHGMLGPGDGLRGEAIEVELGVDPSGSWLGVEARITNTGAGHPLPAGLPGRRIVVRATTLGDGGREIARQERTYARVLVDAAGAEAPFYAAVRVQDDSRLPPEQPRAEHFSFSSRGIEEVRIEVLEHALSPAIAERLGIDPPEPVRLAAARAVRARRDRWETRAP